MEKERVIFKGMRGTCPFCDGENYHRQQFVSDGDYCGDYVFCECICCCGETFQETFLLTCQNWATEV